MWASFQDWWEDFKAGREGARFLVLFLAFIAFSLWFGG